MWLLPFMRQDLASVCYADRGTSPWLSDKSVFFKLYVPQHTNRNVILYTCVYIYALTCQPDMKVLLNIILTRSNFL